MSVFFISLKIISNKLKNILQIKKKMYICINKQYLFFNYENNKSQFV